MTDLPVERASGGVVWREGPDGVEFLQVHRPKYGDWTFPKGKVEDDESLLECASREVWEEAGVTPVVGCYLGRLSYTKRNGMPKVVDYWAMRAGSLAFVPSGEVDRIRWVGEQSLDSRVAYATERELVAGLGEKWRGPADRILLTRHAKAGARGRWGPDDSARPLSKRGTAQAEAIVGLLQWFDIDTIVTSPAARCVETVAPLARARGLVPQISKALWEEAGRTRVESLVESPGGGTRLFCSHRANVRKILRKLVGDPATLPFQKGSTWVFDFVDGKLATSNYLAPPG